MLRVDIDVLEFSGDYIYLLDGLPFTGIAVEYVDGRTICETTYKEGELWGRTVSWDENGHIQAETNYGVGEEVTVGREWFPNGQIKSDTVTRLGRPIMERKWNEEGAIVKEVISEEYDAKVVEAQVMRRASLP